MNDLIEDPRLGLSLCTPVNHSTTNMFQPNISQQQQPNNSHLSFYMNRNNTNNSSVSSLTSTISDNNSNYYSYSNNYTNNKSFDNNLYNFTKEFIDLIMSIYQNLSSDPTITPFDTLNPPTGILNRVAILSIEKASFLQIETGSKFFLQSNAMIVQIRHILNQELKKDGYMSRNGSQSSLLLPLPPQFTELLNSTHNNDHDPVDPNFFKTNGDAIAINSNLLQPQPSIKLNHSTNNYTNNTSHLHNLLPRQTFRTASPLSTTSFSNNNDNSNNYNNNNNTSGIRKMNNGN